MIKRKLYSLKDTKAFACEIAQQVKRGDVIALQGDLGAGKTTWTQFFIGYLAEKKVDVTSPTYTIVHTYQTKRGMVWHYDLYRLEKEEELIPIGLEDALQEGISVIEWPEIARKWLPEHTIEIRFLRNFKSEEIEVHLHRHKDSIHD